MVHFPLRRVDKLEEWSDHTGRPASPWGHWEGCADSRLLEGAQEMPPLVPLQSQNRGWGQDGEEGGDGAAAGMQNHLAEWLEGKCLVIIFYFMSMYICMCVRERMCYVLNKRDR